MKQHTLTSALGVFIALASANVTLAQVQTSGPTNFPMVGIARGQTLLLHLVAVDYPPVPCSMVQLGVQDTNGNNVVQTQTLTLAAGQSAVLSVNGDSLTTAFGQRVELLPTVTGMNGALTAANCVATVEVIDNALREAMVLVPGAVGFPPNPIFGLLGVTVFQKVRLNVVAFPNVPCFGTISFADKNGNQIGQPLAIQLSWQSTFLDLPGNTLVSALGQRAEVRPVVTVTEGACIASAEVYNDVTRATAVYYPPVPCGPESTSCVVFLPSVTN
jgi:hypothetical protein